MILEEKLIFHSEEDANTFCSFTRLKGSRAKISIEGSAFTEEVVTCSIEGYINWLTDMLKEQTDDGSSPYSKDEIQIFKKQLDVFTRTHAKLDQLLTGKEIGEVVYTPEQFENAISSLISINIGEKPEPTQSQENQDVWILIDSILIENHIVTESPEGNRLKKFCNPGDLLNRMLPSSSTEAYRKAGIVHGATFFMVYSIDQPMCRVITDPVLYISYTEDEIMDLLNPMAVDDFSRNYFHNSFSSKRKIITTLIDIVTEKNGVSLDNLTGEMTQYSIPDEDGIHGFAVHLSPYLTEIIVSELIQAKILTGSEKKIRVGKAIKTKRL